MSQNLNQQMTADDFKQAVANEKPKGKGRAKARKRHIDGEPNQTEQRFEQDYLRPLLLAGKIDSYRFESIKLRCGTNTAWLKIDYTIVWAGGEVEQVDVKAKGSEEEDALVKIKAAAAMYPEYHFSWWTWHEKQGVWKVRRFNDHGDHPMDSTSKKDV